MVRDHDLRGVDRDMGVDIKGRNMRREEHIGREMEKAQKQKYMVTVQWPYNRSKDKATATIEENNS